ncbi:hypothetical protein NLI96_g7768 [Meripilus lineatus]|uniref:F-box domain-containing protein n=1 Tax=Meripilus lineatus TaxID=2056292 RepID=A0AAD5V068_9APHY|nr:hypothetical protein NLI96_g7768 [Physisporinus lineatus]
MSDLTGSNSWSDALETWHWSCREGCTRGLVRDWTLSSVLYNELHGLAFTFHVGSDHPQNIPLGFEYLIETYISLPVPRTLELPTILSEVFKQSQEYIWRFTNAKKVKLAFITSESYYATSWRSARDNKKRTLQEEHAAIIAIIEDFMRSQTDVDLDFTIDGLPPKESHLLISGVKTKQLLWPTHVQIPWNIQCHILESIPPYVPDENDDFSTSIYDHLYPISTIYSQAEACSTLQRCSLVCRQWASVSQQLIFRWIRLASHQQMDKLYTILSASGFQSSHLVRRLSIIRHPYEKIGEVIPRIIGMHAIMDILGRELDNYHCVTWRWRYGKGRIGLPGRDWTLSCVTPGKNFCLDFRFHTRSDQPQDILLGCEHLMELSIPHVVGHPWDLRVSLLQRLQGLQELLRGFINLKKIGLALTTQKWRPYGQLWGLQVEDEKQRLQKQYTAIIAIAEVFILSQSSFDMDFTVDGLTLEELHRLISSIPTNELLWPVHTPIPWNIQRHIIESVPFFVPTDGANNVLAFADLTHSRVGNFKPISTIRDQTEACRTLRTCSLVCRQWASVSRKLIFRWICLSNHQQTDKLHSLLRDSQSSHLSQLVRRLSIVYRSPYTRIGEAIPRIIGMGLSRLECLDLCAGEETGALDFPTFPFHPSLRAQLSQLNQVRILHLHNFRFSHLAEFRRFVCAFAGIRHLIAIFVDFGRDELGDYRPIHRSKEWQMPAKISWWLMSWDPWWNENRKAHGDFDAVSAFWLANIPNSRRAIKPEAPCSSACPTLTPDVANAITHTAFHYSTDGEYDPLITWYWRREKGSGGGMRKDWTLSCISSYEHQDHYFRFRMRSDNPPDTPLGFEHLIEPCISHLVTEPRELLVSLHQKLRASHEQFGGFPNVERVKLTLLTQDSAIQSVPWRLQPEKTKRMLQERYTPIIPIVEEFGRSQTDFQLDINIDGFPPEELRLLISDRQTTESSDDRSMATIL